MLEKAHTPERQLPLDIAMSIGELPVNVQARNDWLEATMDGNPIRPLPAVNLVLLEKKKIDVVFAEISNFQLNANTPENTTINRLYGISNSDNQPIGTLIMKEPELQAGHKNSHFIGNIEIDERKQLKGYGQATYLALLKNLPPNTGLRTEGMLSPDSYKMWQRLTRLGIAKQISGNDITTAKFKTIF
jgi:hypothetical protein